MNHYVILTVSISFYKRVIREIFYHKNALVRNILLLWYHKGKLFTPKEKPDKIKTSFVVSGIIPSSCLENHVSLC